MASPHLGAILPNTSPARFPSPDPLLGTHVTLERLSPRHTTDLYAAVGSAESLWTCVPSGPFTSLSNFAAYVHKYTKSSEHAFYAILLKSSGKAVGHVGLWGADLPNRVIEVGPVMYGKDLQRSRAGTEVLYLLGELVFGELGYRRWEWKCNSLNAPSKKAAERYGFVYEGTWRQHMIIRGRNRDTCIYSIVDSEWPMCKEVFEEWLADPNFDAEGRQKRSLNEVREGLCKGQEVVKRLSRFNIKWHGEYL